MGTRVVAGNCQGCSAHNRRRLRRGRLSLCQPNALVRLTLQPNEAGLQSDPEPRRPPETFPSAEGRPFLTPLNTIFRTGRPDRADFGDAAFVVDAHDDLSQRRVSANGI
jgi:hypothetical protein